MIKINDNDNNNLYFNIVRSGAIGITLTAANHVFILEPLLNPALYRQAINRVYRLGQTKYVYIYTLIMKNSIEERIWNINKDKQKKDGDDNDDKKSNKKMNMAGNISGDRSANLASHEIGKLFHVEQSENNNNDNNQ